MRILLYKPLFRPENLATNWRSVYAGFESIRDYLLAYAPGHEVSICCGPSLPDCRGFDMVGLSGVTETWPRVVSSIRHLRETGYTSTILVGGPHITALPHALPEGDVIGVLGPGEETFLDIVTACSEKNTPEFSDIPGLALHNADGEVILTPSRTVGDLNSYPVDVNRHPNVAMQLCTLRGCPYRCMHCVENPTQGGVRSLSAERIAELMEKRLAATGNPDFFFQDDTFLVARGRLQQLVDSMRRRNLLGNVRIVSVSLNANLVQEDDIQCLKAIGAQELGMGAESLNPERLAMIKNGVVTWDDLLRTITYVTRLGMSVFGSQVYGTPGETESQMVDSLKRAIYLEANTNFIAGGTFICQPLPGSRYWEQELSCGRVSESMDFSTLRIDADNRYFDSHWHYMNEEFLPRHRLLELLSKYGKLPYNTFGYPRSRLTRLYHAMHAGINVGRSLCSDFEDMPASWPSRSGPYKKLTMVAKSMRRSLAS